MKKFLTVALLISLTGCVVKEKRYYPAFGTGVTIVTLNPPGTVRTETVIIGIGLVPRPFVRCILGFGRVSTVQITTNNILMDLK